MFPMYITINRHLRDFYVISLAPRQIELKARESGHLNEQAKGRIENTRGAKLRNRSERCPKKIYRVAGVGFQG